MVDQTCRQLFTLPTKILPLQFRRRHVWRRNLEMTVPSEATDGRTLLQVISVWRSACRRSWWSRSRLWHTEECRFNKNRRTSIGWRCTRGFVCFAGVEFESGVRTAEGAQMAAPPWCVRPSRLQQDCMGVVIMSMVANIWPLRHLQSPFVERAPSVLATWRELEVECGVGVGELLTLDPSDAAEASRTFRHAPRQWRIISLRSQR